jgi:serine/threonine protein kinase
MEQSGQRFGKFLLFEDLGSEGNRKSHRARGAKSGPSVRLTRIEVESAHLGRFFPVFTREMSRVGFLFHTGVQRVYEFGLVEGVPFFTEEDFHGASLRALLAEARRQRVLMPIPCALFVARELAAALAYAHDRRLRNEAPLGIVHGAVLPHTVWVAKNGEVKLGSFGILRALQQLGMPFSFSDGPPRDLLAPEVLAGAPVGPGADVFGCASVLYAALTLRGPGEVARNGKVPPPSSLRARVSSAIDAVCAVALSPSPLERHAHAAELEAELTRILYQESPLFATRDLGDFVCGLSDGTLVEAFAPKRRARRHDPREEGGPRDDRDTERSVLRRGDRTEPPAEAVRTPPSWPPGPPSGPWTFPGISFAAGTDEPPEGSSPYRLALWAVVALLGGGLVALGVLALADAL